ncbi:hypothetical protein Catovirus_2_187 [Catovirus CTV1]|uniref:Uncharacterized protein n=1 Tax=Catovirus CTV1 TaxID=1977631 RepID=A0A1V0SC59_9VIRU|nr:hypothetical protein Catovirus_2_187 [Catovirus CTV1]
MNNSTNTKFPKSQSGLQCLSPCYPADLSTIHPITLRYYKSDFPYCHVTYKIGEDQNVIDDIDKCYNPISMDEYKKMSVDILIPLIDFNCKHFLIIFNNIKTLEDGMEYLEKKKYTSVVTRSRVVNCILKVYGDSMEIIDQRLVDFFIELAKKKWIMSIYNALHIYVYSNESIIKFINPKDNMSTYNDYKIERINYLISKFINFDEMYKFLNKYFNHRKEKWNDIENFIENIKSDFIIYIENKINHSLNYKSNSDF